MNRAIDDAIRKVLEQSRPLTIIQAGDPVLRHRAADVPTDLDRGLLTELTAAMRETMLAAPGVGLAAPQIGLGIRLAVVEDPAGVPGEVADARDRRPLEFTTLINPEYRQIGHDTALWYEGCLSIAGWQAATERAVTVELRFQDEDLAPAVERFSGWQARIVQHETDHLSGTLYLDHAIMRSLTDNVAYTERWSGPDLQPARSELGF